MVYQWKTGAFGKIGAVKAVAAGKVLEQLEKKGGGITAQAVVNAARPIRSRIHNWFEWDDTTAAEKHREWQARDMVKSIMVIYEDSDEEQECRAFVNITEDNQRQYVSTARVLSDTSLKQQAVNAVLSGIGQLQHKLKAYEGYEKAIATLGRASKQIKKR